MKVVLASYFVLLFCYTIGYGKHLINLKDLAQTYRIDIKLTQPVATMSLQKTTLYLKLAPEIKDSVVHLVAVDGSRNLIAKKTLQRFVYIAYIESLNKIDRATSINAFMHTLCREIYWHLQQNKTYKKITLSQKKNNKVTTASNWLIIPLIALFLLVVSVLSYCCYYRLWLRSPIEINGEKNAILQAEIVSSVVKFDARSPSITQQKKSLRQQSKLQKYGL